MRDKRVRASRSPPSGSLSYAVRSNSRDSGSGFALVRKATGVAAAHMIQMRAGSRWKPGFTPKSSCIELSTNTQAQVPSLRAATHSGRVF